jgi:hypothetical protein
MLKVTVEQLYLYHAYQLYQPSTAWEFASQDKDWKNVRKGMGSGDL